MHQPGGGGHRRETHPGPATPLASASRRAAAEITAGGKEAPSCSFLLGRPIRGLALLSLIAWHSSLPPWLGLVADLILFLPRLVRLPWQLEKRVPRRMRMELFRVVLASAACFPGPRERFLLVCCPRDRSSQQLSSVGVPLCFCARSDPALGSSGLAVISALNFCVRFTDM